MEITATVAQEELLLQYSVFHIILIKYLVIRLLP